MTSITLKAPAKVNLFLKVRNKRKDGYHNILTLFERIALADKITISKIREGIEVSSNKHITDRAQDNLVYKAAESIFRYARRKKKALKGAYKGVRIRVKKVIPIAAGLGGGSSDAASVLAGINKLYELDLKEKELMVLAADLGADVPFFLLDAPFAIGRSIGDKLEKMKAGQVLWHLIVCAGQKVSTKEVYGAFDERMKRLTPRLRSGSSPRLLSKDLTRNYADDKINPVLRLPVDFNSAESMLYNNLEETITSKEPVTGAILERLAYSTGSKAIISGSGPSVFCLCRSRKEAIGAKRAFLGSMPADGRKGWQIFITKTLY